MGAGGVPTRSETEYHAERRRFGTSVAPSHARVAAPMKHSEPLIVRAAVAVASGVAGKQHKAGRVHLSKRQRFAPKLFAQVHGHSLAVVPV